MKFCEKVETILKKLFFRLLRVLMDSPKDSHNRKQVLIEPLFYDIICNAVYDFRILFQNEAMKR